MDRRECVERILHKIPFNYYFDSHYIVEEMIKGFPDEYDALFDVISGEGDMLKLRVHQYMGHVIKRFDGTLITRKAGQSSWSMNVNGVPSKCALWQKISQGSGKVSRK